MFSILLDGHATGGTSAAMLLAYLDPGTGSMALQVLIAGALSSVFFLKSSLIQLKDRLFKSRQGR